MIKKLNDSIYAQSKRQHGKCRNRETDRQTGQSNLAKAVSNAFPLLSPRGIGTQCSLERDPKSFHPKQDLNPFSQFCTQKPSEDARHTDWLTDRLSDRNIGSSCLHLMHSMQPKIYSLVLELYTPSANRTGVAKRTIIRQQVFLLCKYRNYF